MGEQQTEDHDKPVRQRSRRALEVLRRRIWVVVGCTVLVAVAALSASFLESTEYSSTASIRFQDPTQWQLPYSPQPFSETDGATKVSTNLKLTSLDPVAGLAARKVQANLTKQDVIDAVDFTTTVDETTTLQEPYEVTATVSGSDAAYTAEIANAYIRSYLAIRRESDREKVSAALTPILNQHRKLSRREKRSESGQILKLKIERIFTLKKLLEADEAKEVQYAPATASHNNKSKVPNLLGGLFLGLLLGIGTALLMERQGLRKNASAPSVSS